MNAITVLIQAVEASGFSVSGPTDVRAAEHGEPAWVCNARAAIAENTAAREDYNHGYETALRDVERQLKAIPGSVVEYFAAYVCPKSDAPDWRLTAIERLPSGTTITLASHTTEPMKEER